MVKNYIFLGPPGVGKGTLAQLVEKKHGIKHISTGDIFRNNIKNKTPIGIKVKKILDSGEYVSDDLTNEIVKDAIFNDSVKKSGFILDGYPRTLNQAQFLKDINLEITGAVLLHASDEVILHRLTSRARGEDDTPEVIKRRLEVYNKKTKPLIDFYKKENKLIIVSSEGTIDENMNRLEKELF